MSAKQKVALLFPGQGAQYVGMGKKIDDLGLGQYLNLADRALKDSLSTLMKEGPEEKLNLTEFTQPALIGHSVALFEHVKPQLEENFEIDCVLGHSVGEYAALYAAGVLSFEDAVKLVNLRGQFMQEAVPAGEGSMLAVLKVPEDTVRKGCEEISKEVGPVMPANFNEPTQIVVSGKTEAVSAFHNWLKEHYVGPFRAVELKVSAPFHSSLMEPAAKKMKSVLEDTALNPTNYDYIANIDAKRYSKGTTSDIVIKNLTLQIAGSVLWTQSIQSLSEDTLCLEIGPGRVLAGLVKKINPNIKVLSLDKENDLDEFFHLV